MATRKVKDERGREYEIEVDDDDDDDDDGDGPFIDESDLKGLFDKWLGERESSSKTKPKGIRIKTQQTKPSPPASKKADRTRRLRIA